MVYDLVTFLSLLATPAVVLGSVYVVFIWKDYAIEGLDRGAEITFDHHVYWLVIGILISFVGGAFDSLYWGIAWTADFLDWDSRDFWFKNGVYSNLVFRQGCDVFAVLCHVYSAMRYFGTNAIYVLYFVALVTAGFAGFLLLN